MIFTVLTYTSAPIYPLRNSAGEVKAIGYGVDVVMDGALQTFNVPNTVEILEAFKTIVEHHLLRLKHITIKTNDTIANTGYVAVYATSSTQDTHRYEFTIAPFGTSGADVDFLMGIEGRSLALGLVQVRMNTIPTNTKIIGVSLYFEVE